MIDHHNLGTAHNDKFSNTLHVALAAFFGLMALHAVLHIATRLV